ncbi:MAG: DUF2851 family protein [Urechidicola sp.]|nr:DUF2851 family protein [Urechidicola sp.]
MKEDLLHYLWQYKLFYTNNLRTTNGATLDVVLVGVPNTNSGPDFFNAQLRIDKQLWAGNVEIHVKSSDWYVHNHENDENYDNVILHVVWEHDVAVFTKDNTEIPTLELQQLVSKDLLATYHKLFSKQQKWINCEQDIVDVNEFVFHNWKERLYFERLEQKALLIEVLLVETNNNWEAVLFQLLAKNFGLKTNATAFFEMAQQIDFSIVRKEAKQVFNLESLFFGQLGMLKETSENAYYNKLKKEYNYQLKKYKLPKADRSMVEYFRLRPPNFPTIRISQLASLYSLQQNLFAELIQLKTLDAIYDFLSVSVSEFWKTHYTFEKESLKRNKKLTKSFIDLLLINTIIPLKFVYLKQYDKLDQAVFMKLIEQLKPEKNSVIDNFLILKIKSKNAFETQALLQLKRNYCEKQKCLQCAIGNYLLKS